MEFVSFSGGGRPHDNSKKHFRELGRSIAAMSCQQFYYVYIMASRRNGTLYTGMTGDLATRAYQHRNDIIRGFTSRYAVHRLVWFEVHSEVNAAIRREKCIKKWRRAWKLDLIEAFNPYWEDLFARDPRQPSCRLCGDDGS